MSDTLLVSTRKGLFWIKRSGGTWAIDRADFLGDNVTLSLSDRRSGRTFAALDHGHFGVKVHRTTGDLSRGGAVRLCHHQGLPHARGFLHGQVKGQIARRLDPAAQEAVADFGEPVVNFLCGGCVRYLIEQRANPDGRFGRRQNFDRRVGVHDRVRLRRRDE